MTEIADYIVDSYSYLKRARKRLDENTPSSLFYAAFELRCGVESKMQEYLNAQNHISEKKKKGWKIAKLGKNIEQAFRKGDEIVELSVLNKASGEARFRFYYTPVTKKLRDNTESLNAYIHAQRRPDQLNELWWNRFWKLVESVYFDLEIANRGSLMGPPLWYPKTREMITTLVFLDDQNGNKVKNFFAIGTMQIFKVQYYNSFPS